MLGDSQRDFYETRIQRLTAEVPGFRPDIVRTILSLAQAHDSVARRINVFLAPHDLSTATLNALIILSEKGSLPLSELSLLLLKTAANVTGLVDGLVKRGLVQRRPHDQDRRVKLVSLTRQGRELFERLFPQYHALVTDIFGALSPSELETATALLMRLARSAGDAGP